MAKYYLKKSNNENDNEEEELIILNIPVQYTTKRKHTNYFFSYSKKNKVNNNSFNDYRTNLIKSTEMCISLMRNMNVYKEGSNIYCPFHENKNKSQSPSAIFYVDKNTYICYSTNCPLRNSYTNSNRKPYVCSNSISLYRELTSLLKM